MKHTQTRRNFFRKIVMATAAIPMARMAHARNVAASGCGKTTLLNLITNPDRVERSYRFLITCSTAEVS